MFETIVIIALLVVAAYVFFRSSSKGLEVIDEVTEQPIAVVNEKKAEEPAKVVAKPAAKKASKPRAKKTV